MRKIDLVLVDDDPRILKGLSRRIRRLRPDWSLRLAESGNEALRLADLAPPDVIVCDLRMPGMDGASVLRQIMERFPGTYRMALSGQAEQKLILRAADHAHSMQAKPCDLDFLIQSIEDGLEMLNYLQRDDLRAWVSGLNGLPKPSRSESELLLVLGDPDVDLSTCSELSQQDPGLTSAILRVANSAYFGGHEISNTMEAIQRMGLSLVKPIVQAELLRRRVQVDPKVQVHLEDIVNFSQNMVEQALYLRKCSIWKHLDLNDVMTAGLLHDIGRMLFLAFKPELALEMLDQFPEKGDCLEEERKFFACDHCELGAILLQLWKIPPTITKAVSEHHRVPGPNELHKLSSLLFFAGVALQHIRLCSHNMVTVPNEAYLEGLPPELLNYVRNENQRT